MGDYGDFLEKSGSLSATRWTRYFDTNSAAFYYVSPDGQESVWEGDPRAPSSFEDLAGPEWSHVQGQEQGQSGGGGQKVKKKTNKKPSKKKERDKGREKERSTKHGSGGGDDVKEGAGAMEVMAVDDDDDNDDDHGRDDDMSRLLEAESTSSSSVQNRDPLSRVVADTEVDIGKYTYSAKLHAALFEGPLVTVEAVVRGLFCLGVGVASLLMWLCWRRGNASTQRARALARAMGWLREAAINGAAMLTFFVPGTVFFVYRSFGSVDDWRMSPLPTVLGWVDTRRFATFVYGLGASSSGLDIPPDGTDGGSGTGPGSGTVLTDKAHPCQDSVGGPSNYCLPRMLAKRFREFTQSARREEPTFIADMRAQRDMSREKSRSLGNGSGGAHGAHEDHDHDHDDDYDDDDDDLGEMEVELSSFLENDL
jgi:hypothetical protein